jgi:nicotinamide-nucleotide amidase
LVTSAASTSNSIIDTSSGTPSVIAVSARAGIVVTGTEVLTGRIADRNGPWIADRLLELGVELAHITICGDRASDIEAQLRFLAGEGVELIVTAAAWGRPPTI